MKKLLLSIGSIAAVVTPVVAVVSCGKKEEAAHDYKADVKSEFIAAGSSATMGWFFVDGKDATKTVNYNRLNIVIKRGSELEKLILAVAKKVDNNVTDVNSLDTNETFVNKVEGYLSAHLKTLGTSSASIETIINPGQTQVPFGVYASTNDDDAEDDHFELAINGFATKAASVKFLKDAANSITDNADIKNILTIIANAI